MKRIHPTAIIEEDVAIGDGIPRQRLDRVATELRLLPGPRQLDQLHRGAADVNADERGAFRPKCAPELSQNIFLH